MLTVKRSEWLEEDVALLCGIANAGGGNLLVSPNAGSHTKRLKAFRKSFESIPRLSQRELGLACTTEPIMDGIELCLEIQVPAATTPLRYRGKYYFYADGVNTVVTKDILDRLNDTQVAEEDSAVANEFSQDAATSEPTTQPEPQVPVSASPQAQAPVQAQPQRPMTATSTDPRATFKDRSVAAANRLDLTSTDEFILKALETNGRVTAIRIADVLGVSESTVRRSFRRLRETGFIERIGSNKAGYWRLVD